MTEMMFATSHYRQTIFASLLEARKIHGGKHTVAKDLERIPLSYDNLITRTIAIGNALKNDYGRSGKMSGFFCPIRPKPCRVILGLQLYGRVPAMLNYSTGSAGMISACNTAQVKTVLTSRRFIETGQVNRGSRALGRTG